MTEVTISADAPYEYGEKPFACFKPATRWLKKNVKAGFKLSKPRQDRWNYPRALLTVEFERQEDAALFKLFWC